jgi:hypothetical protein
MIQILSLILVSTFYVFILMKLTPLIENKLIKLLVLMLLNALATAFYMTNSYPEFLPRI